MKSYADKLKDPKWQKKRLEVLSYRNFKCQECGDSEQTLHIHHPYYEKGKEPWDYDAYILMCLCEVCHKERHYFESILTGYVNEIKSNPNLSLTYFMGLLAGHIQDGNMDTLIIDDMFCDGFGEAFKRSGDIVAESINENGFVTYETCDRWRREDIQNG